MLENSQMSKETTFIQKPIPREFIVSTCRGSKTIGCYVNLSLKYTASSGHTQVPIKYRHSKIFVNKWAKMKMQSDAWKEVLIQISE